MHRHRVLLLALTLATLGADGDAPRPWTRIEIRQGALSSVAWSGNLFAAVGHDAVLTSVDGLQWRAHDVPAHADLKAVVWGARRFVAVGGTSGDDAPVVLTSTDGEEWTAHPVPGGRPLDDVAFSGDAFVAIGSGAVLRSSDGMDWTEAGSSADVTLRRVTWGDGLFMAAGSRPGRDGAPLIATSADGASWTTRETRPGGVLNDVAWSGSRFVAVGTAAPLTSVDAATWSPAISAPAADLNAAAWGGTQFAAVGSSRDRPIVLTSRDGLTWSREPLGGDGALLDVTWGADRFVAVGRGHGKEGDDALIATSPLPADKVPDPARWRIAALPGPRQEPPPPAPPAQPAPQPPPPAHPPTDNCPAKGWTESVTGVNWTFGWTLGECFEIERIEGIQPRYEPGAVFTTRLFGRALTSDVVPEPKNGFCVQAYIDHHSVNRSLDGANGRWDEGLHAWVVEHHVPAMPLPEYRLEFALYCCEDESICAKTYGRAAQTMMDFHFDTN